MVTHPPVKVNLGLNVLRKRDDGFHDVETCIVKCHQISDTLEIVSGDDRSLTLDRLSALYGEDALSQNDDGRQYGEDGLLSLLCEASEDGKVAITMARRGGVGWPLLEDLSVKAYRLLDEDFGLPPVKIFLEKTSPVGAGLGGGSADAAYALMMLSEMFGLGLDKGRLCSYAYRLGADCAFFVMDEPVMMAGGRGEELTPFSLGLEIVEPEEGITGQGEMGGKTLHPWGGMASRHGGGEAYELRIVAPEGVSISTKEAYRNVVPHIPTMRLEDVLKMPVSCWKEMLRNDFEATIFASHPQLALVKRSLYGSGAVYASMSGSGSALFALYKV